MCLDDPRSSKDFKVFPGSGESGGVGGGVFRDSKRRKKGLADLEGRLHAAQEGRADHGPPALRRLKLLQSQADFSGLVFSVSGDASTDLF